MIVSHKSSSNAAKPPPRKFQIQVQVLKGLKLILIIISTHSPESKS